MHTRQDQAAEFRRALRAVISQRRWTQANLASRVGASQPTVGNWLRGRSVPDANTVFAVERAFSLIPGELSVHLGYVPIDRGSFLSDLTLHLLVSTEGRALMIAGAGDVRKSCNTQNETPPVAAANSDCSRRGPALHRVAAVAG